MNIIYNGEKDAAFKDVLGATIPALSAADDKVIYLDADLMNCIGTGKFGAAHPERGIDCGIAEANMMGIAAGLSAVGCRMERDRRKSAGGGAVPALLLHRQQPGLLGTGQKTAAGNRTPDCRITGDCRELPQRI